MISLSILYQIEARQKLDLLVLNSESYQNLLISNLRNIQKFYAFFGIEKLRRQQFKYRVKYFLLIFLHGSIELVELYKTVYIKKILSHLFEVKNSKQLFGKSQKMFKKLSFFNGRKTLDFSIKLAFLFIFATSDVSKCT